jgi:hypothetical protein
MATALDGVRPSTRPSDLEDIMALRRTVLEPLLSPEASPAARALLPHAASSFGYRLIGPGAWPGGGAGVALIPAEPDRSLALFAKLGPRMRIVEAPLAGSHRLRDLALRTAVAVGADTIILGESAGGERRMGAVRAAHAAATNAAGLGSTIFLVRGDESAAAEGVRVASWMDGDGSALALARNSLGLLGLASATTTADLSLRDVATRTLLRPMPVVAISVDGTSLLGASLDSARHLAQRLPHLAIRDGRLRDAAVALAAQLPMGLTPSPEDIDESVRRATADDSILAAHRLDDAVAGSTCAGAIVRTGEGTFVVVAARTPTRLILTMAGTESRGGWRRERRSTLRDCAETPADGTCEATQR